MAEAAAVGVVAVVQFEVAKHNQNQNPELAVANGPLRRLDQRH